MYHINIFRGNIPPQSNSSNMCGVFFFQALKTNIHYSKELSSNIFFPFQTFIFTNWFPTSTLDLSTSEEMCFSPNMWVLTHTPIICHCRFKQLRGRPGWPSHVRAVMLLAFLPMSGHSLSVSGDQTPRTTMRDKIHEKCLPWYHYLASPSCSHFYSFFLPLPQLLPSSLSSGRLQ